MKKLLFTILISLFLTTFAHAEEATLTFEKESAQRMVVDLETCKILQEQYTLLESAYQELEKEKDILKEIVKTQKEKIEVQDKVCEEVIKKVKPSFWDKMGWRAEGAGIATVMYVIVGVMLLIL